MVLSMLYMYLMRNFSRLVGLEPKEPLAGRYDRDYFRATWVATALDAGFWKAMWIRPRWLRDIASIAGTLYYLVCAEQADEYVRKIRAGGCDIDHMRVAWNKGRTPYIKLASWLVRPNWCMKTLPIRSQIQRPEGSAWKEPIDFWLYYDKPQDMLSKETKIILDIPGGGFVAMDPRCHDDKLFAWAGKSKLPVVALNYKKAPEYPYPFALEECFDAYLQIILTRGKCIGLSGETMPKIVLSGDSAGGNLATSMVVKLLQSNFSDIYNDSYRQSTPHIPLPEALILIYPALEMNIHSFMRPEDVELLIQPEYRKQNKKFIKRKSEAFRRLTPKTPHGSDDEDDTPRASSPRIDTPREKSQSQLLEDKVPTKSPVATDAMISASNGQLSTNVQMQPRKLRTNIKMSSMISQLHDRVLPPELLRAMILLYIGEQHKPDLTTDHLLSPLLAPELILQRFPKVYMMCGEQDPLADDTFLFAARLRQAHRTRFRERQDVGLESYKAIFNDKKHVETIIINGVSHGFLQFVTVYHPGWEYIDQCRRWMMDAFYESDQREAGMQSEPPTPMTAEPITPADDYFSTSSKNERLGQRDRHHRRKESNSDAEDRPLEMTPLRSRADITNTERGRRRSSAGRGSIKKFDASGRKSPVAIRKGSMLPRLGSDTNFFERRMVGLTGDLLGKGSGTESP
jgi:acetyl esterase/lipase